MLKPIQAQAPLRSLLVAAEGGKAQRSEWQPQSPALGPLHFYLQEASTASKGIGQYAKPAQVYGCMSSMQFCVMGIQRVSGLLTILLSVFPVSFNPNQPAYAQQSWQMPGYPQSGRLGASNQPMINRRYVNTHSLECFDLRRSQNVKVPPRSCLIGGGVAIHVSSKDFLPKLRIDGPTGVLPPTISEVIRGELKRVVFCPQHAGRYVVNVTSGTVSVQGEYSIEAVYAPSCS